MSSLIDRITEWIIDGLVSGLLDRFANMFTTLNSKVGDAAVLIGQSPADWNPAVFAMIRTLSETVIIPIAGIILTFVLCHELIHMIIDGNNMHNFETATLFKWLFKTFVATYILTHTFDLVMAVFELAQSVVTASAGLVGGSLDIALNVTDLEAQLRAMGMWELIGLWLETMIIEVSTGFLSAAIIIVVWGRLIEIYLTVSVAPIPLATLANREWGQVGSNYIKALFAVAFQGFLMMVCVAIYGALVAGITASANMHLALWTTAAYSAMLFFALLKTGSLSRSLFGTH